MKGGPNMRVIRNCRMLAPAFGSRQCGATLVVSLILLVALLMLGISAAQLTLQGEKISRGERDRQIAIQAAEAALIDAELDIHGSPDAARSRSHIFSSHSAQGFPNEREAPCHSGQANQYLGLCRHAAAEETPTWQLVNFDERKPELLHSVPFGRFTGKKFETGKGVLPSRSPHYIIELMVYNMPGADAQYGGYFYRVTAIGYGIRETTQVVLQSVYRKEDA